MAYDKKLPPLLIEEKKTTLNDVLKPKSRKEINKIKRSFNYRFGESWKMFKLIIKAITWKPEPTRYNNNTMSERGRIFVNRYSQTREGRDYLFEGHSYEKEI